MSSEEGFAIACERIAREAKEKTGFLDLGQLGLTKLPGALFGLTHLRALTLGSRYLDRNGEWQACESYLARNGVSQELPSLIGLTALQALFLGDTDLTDLSLLAALTNLQSLSCCGTQVSDLAPLAGLTNLQSLDCSGTPVSGLAPLARLTNLQSLDCSATQVNGLAPLAGLTSLRSLYCSRTQVSDLALLAGLTNLQSLSCSGTQVSDLAPLAGLTNLQSLSCSDTQVNGLAPLAGLINLQSLSCSDTQVNGLAPLAGLTSLRSLYCSRTQVSDLAPLAGLTSLQLLDCRSTRVSDLAPLAGLTNLQTFTCSGTQVSDLAPLAGLTNLKSLFCTSTPVSDLAPLAGLSDLQLVSCSSTQVSDLAPLAGLANLQTLGCSRCNLTGLPEALLFKDSLQELALNEARVPGIPTEILSGYNCLESLRAHVRDLEVGSSEMPDVKLMVLGNGRVGKTQLCRRLRGEVFDDRVESTHGIIVTSAPLRQPDEPEIRLQIWDFGGQDIYHGTHALFMRSRAIFALLWIPEAEKAPEHRHGGFTFRNQPLAYWLEYVRHFGGAESPVLIVQTRCDRPEDEELQPPVSGEALKAFPFRKVLHYGAKGANGRDRGRPALDDALREAVATLRACEGGIAVIGAGRARVKRQIEAMRDADAARPPLERAHRTLNQEEYLKLCGDAGGISDAKQLLAYLHDAGTVFYREKLFENRIIVDQGWALELIYAVFNREKCYGKLVKQRGRFTRADLAEWVWDEAGHGMEEQKLFISMMQSCGICFQHRAASYDGKFEAEYIAPDLLPEKPESEIAQKWDSDRECQTAEFEYPLLPQALMRGVIARIGSAAGLAADYWRDGVYVYEATTGSRGLIEQKATWLWQGRISVQTQRGQAGLLLERLVKLIDEEQSRTGISPSNKRAPSARALTETETGRAPEKTEPVPLKFTQEPPLQPELFVSYATGDDSAEGKKRAEVVDKLCAAAQTQGLTILRDEKTLGLGDRISKFMNCIGQGARIFIVLSDKYLKSPYCMYELTEVWRNCLQDEEKFLDRIRIITLPDAKISTPMDRIKYASHWHEKRKELDAMAKAYDMSLLGEKDFKQYKLMQVFSSQVGDILATVADIIQPRTDEEFATYALQDLTANTGEKT